MLVALRKRAAMAVPTPFADVSSAGCRRNKPATPPNLTNMDCAKVSTLMPGLPAPIKIASNSASLRAALPSRRSRSLGCSLTGEYRHANPLSHTCPVSNETNGTWSLEGHRGADPGQSTSVRGRTVARLVESEVSDQLEAPFGCFRFQGVCLVQERIRLAVGLTKAAGVCDREVLGVSGSSAARMAPSKGTRQPAKSPGTTSTLSSCISASRQMSTRLGMSMPCWIISGRASISKSKPAWMIMIRC